MSAPAEPIKAEQSKKDINFKGILLLGLAVLVITPALYWLVGWRVAWALLVVAPLIGYFLFVPPKYARVFVYAYLTYVIAFITATVLQSQLAENSKFAETIEEQALLRFFLGGEEGGFAKQVLFSISVGVLLALLLVNVPLLAVMLASSEWVLALRRSAGIDRRTALRYLWSLIMNIQYPWIIVEKGQDVESKPKGVLADLGGPGNIVIRPGNVVVLWRHGKVTRVVGPGLVRTKRFEQIREIVELKPMWTSNTYENVLTKDRIPLRVLLGVGYQIEPKAVVDSRPDSDTPPDGVALTPVLADGVYQVYEGSVRKAVFDTASNWAVTTTAVGENLMRDVVATYLFDQIFKRRDEGLEVDLPGPFNADERTIKEIEERISAEHSRLSALWGVHSRGIDIKAIELPAEAQAQMLAWWQATWQRRLALRESEVVREQLTNRGLGEAKAIEHIEGVRALEQDRLIDSLCRSVQRIQQDFSAEGLELADRLLTVMERISTALSGTDRSTTMRYVEALERMAAESGTKVLMVGARREWLPRQLGEEED